VTTAYKVVEHDGSQTFARDLSQPRHFEPDCDHVDERGTCLHLDVRWCARIAAVSFKRRDGKWARVLEVEYDPDHIVPGRRSSKGTAFAVTRFRVVGEVPKDELERLASMSHSEWAAELAAHGL
jgi:hypothetical protein